MTISNKHKIGFLVVFWAGAAVMGALWGSKGNMVGWFAFVAGLVSVFITSQLPAENPVLKSKVAMAMLGLGFLSEVLIIIDMGGALS